MSRVVRLTKKETIGKLATYEFTLNDRPVSIYVSVGFAPSEATRANHISVQEAYAALAEAVGSKVLTGATLKTVQEVFYKMIDPAAASMVKKYDSGVYVGYVVQRDLLSGAAFEGSATFKSVGGYLFVK